MKPLEYKGFKFGIEGALWVARDSTGSVVAVAKSIRLMRKKLVKLAAFQA